MDRIADTHDFLDKNAEYKKVLLNKEESKKILRASISDERETNALLDYITTVNFLIDEVKTIFYEHGFQDCATISRAMLKGLNITSLHTLLELDVE